MPPPPLLSRIEPPASGESLLTKRITFRAPITVLVGNNGSGKSTVLRTIAASLGLPLAGGSLNEASLPPSGRPALGNGTRVGWRARPARRSFFSGDNVVGLAALLEARAADPDFAGDPAAAYGGHLAVRSHGQGVLAMLRHALENDFLLLDEPETALSPSAQLAVCANLMAWAEGGERQAVIASHSPFFMRIPGAELIELSSREPRIVTYRDAGAWVLHARATTEDESEWERIVRALLAKDAPS